MSHMHVQSNTHIQKIVYEREREWGSYHIPSLLRLYTLKVLPPHSDDECATATLPKSGQMGMEKKMVITIIIAM